MRDRKGNRIMYVVEALRTGHPVLTALHVQETRRYHYEGWTEHSKHVNQYPVRLVASTSTGALRKVRKECERLVKLHSSKFDAAWKKFAMHTRNACAFDDSLRVIERYP